MSVSTSMSSITVRRGFAYSALIAANSSFIIPISFSRLAKIDRYSSISCPMARNSSWILSRSRPVKRCSFKSKIALACASLKRYVPLTTSRPGSAINLTSASTSPAGHAFASSASFASVGFAAVRISSMTGSRFSTAIAKPTNTCALSRALLSLNTVRRRITSSRNSIKAPIISFKFIIIGRPPLIASIFMPKLVCSCVYL